MKPLTFEAAKSPNVSYVPAVDHIRAFAALLVIFHHCREHLDVGARASMKATRPLAPGEFTAAAYSPLDAFIIEGHTGVALFMVLSGFIFTYAAYGKQILYGRFVLNRILRIYPLMIVLFFAGVIAKRYEIDLFDVASLLLIPFSLGGPFEMWFVPQIHPFTTLFWTIAPEFQFYLMFPFLLILVNRSGLGALYALLGVAIAVRAGLVVGGMDAQSLSYWTIFGRIDQFLIGMIGAIIYPLCAQIRLGPLAPLSLFIMGFLLFGFNHIGGDPARAWWKVFWPPVEGVIWLGFILGYLRAAPHAPRWFALVMGRIGQISFSIYLLHFFVIFTFLKVGPFSFGLGADLNIFLNTTLFVIPATLALSMATYQLIEKPFLSLRVRYFVSGAAARPAAAEPEPLPVFSSPPASLSPAAPLEAAPVFQRIREETPTVAAPAAARPPSSPHGPQRRSSRRTPSRSPSARRSFLPQDPESVTRWVAFAVMGSFALPSDLTISAGGLSLSALRLVLLVMFLPALHAYVRRMSTPNYILVLSDICIVVLALWMLISVSITNGVDRAIEGSGVLILEIVGAYAIGRMYLGSMTGFRAFHSAIRLALILAIPIALLDTASGSYLVSDISNSLTGKPLNVDMQHRFGLIRAKGPFEHSILFGVFCAMAAPILVYGARELPAKIGYVALCMSGIVLAISSAPMLCLLIFVALYCYDRTLARMPARWTLLAVVALFLMAALFGTQERPIESLIGAITLEPQTGLFRLQIWQWVINYNLAVHPMVGIGFADWVRPFWMDPSVDALWLGHALTFGIPSSVLLALVMFGSMSAVTQKRTLPPARDRPSDRARLSLSMTLIFMALIGLTVHFWGTVWVFMGLLAGARAGMTEELHLESRRAAASKRARRPMRRLEPYPA